MASSYLSRAGTPRETSQREAIPGSTQVENSAGGFSWEVGSLARLRRFLVLGSSGGSYYATERKLTKDNVANIRLALAEHGVAAVSEIVKVSKEGLAPKNDEAIYALAVAASFDGKVPGGGQDVPAIIRRAALNHIPDVCRTGTHLFMFCEFINSMRGWGPALRKAVAAWYEEKDPDSLAYQVVKYRQRDGWAQRDVLRLAHPEGSSLNHRALYNWICGRGMGEDLPEIAVVFTAAQMAATPKDTVKILQTWPGLPREALQTEHLNDPGVWRALLANGMPMTALLRNLPTLTRREVLKPLAPEVQAVTAQLTNVDAIRKARIHPLNVLTAKLTYASGHSLRGQATWEPVAQVTDALESMFYLAFQTIEPTGKRFLLALDVSGSMGCQVGDVPGLSARLASAAMAMATARSGDPYEIVAFAHQMVPLNITASMDLNAALGVVSGLPSGGTDCALPMLYALERNIEADAFIVYTDSETWYDQIHPAQALQRYRRETGIDARLVVVALVANPFTIADPNDGGMLDVVGMDASAPRVIADFAAGRI